jgi:hypothetical protein
MVGSLIYELRAILAPLSKKELSLVYLWLFTYVALLHFCVGMPVFLVTCDNRDGQ